MYALTPCIAVLCLSHPSCCQRADACRFERLVECASEGHAWGSHGSLVSDPACEQLARCTVPRHARDVAGPAKKTGAVVVVERLQSNASVQRVLFDSVSTYLLLYLQRPSKSQRLGVPCHLCGVPQRLVFGQTCTKSSFHGVPDPPTRGPGDPRGPHLLGH